MASNGNLYVANTNGNNLLVYSPSHAQLAAKIISNQILATMDVAFDCSGNLAIANAGNNTIVEYTPESSTVIMDRISHPFAIAFDALDDLWVNNGYSTSRCTRMGLWRPSYRSMTTAISYRRCCLQGICVLGGNIDTLSYEISDFPTDQSIPRREVTTETCFAGAYDAVGNLHCGNQNQSLTVVTQNGPQTLVPNLGFFPSGLAIDNARRYIYGSNTIGNSIAVYHTSGTLLYTTTN